MGLAWQQGPLATRSVGQFLVADPLPERQWLVESENVVLPVQGPGQLLRHRAEQPSRLVLRRGMARGGPRVPYRHLVGENQWHLKPQRSSQSTSVACASSITTAGPLRARSGSRRSVDGSRLGASISRAIAKRISRHTAASTRPPMRIRWKTNAGGNGRSAARSLTASSE